MDVLESVRKYLQEKGILTPDMLEQCHVFHCPDNPSDKFKLSFVDRKLLYRKSVTLHDVPAQRADLCVEALCKHVLDMADLVCDGLR